MKKIDISPYGSLQYEVGHCAGYDLATPIGPIAVDVDGNVFSVSDIQSKILLVLGKIEDIDRQARAFLQDKATQQVQASGGLLKPSLFLNPDDEPGTFTVFYSGAREDDETCYGVEFRNFTAFDLTIGD